MTLGHGTVALQVVLVGLENTLNTLYFQRNGVDELVLDLIRGLRAHSLNILHDFGVLNTVSALGNLLEDHLEIGQSGKLRNKLQTVCEDDAELSLGHGHAWTPLLERLVDVELVSAKPLYDFFANLLLSVLTRSLRSIDASTQFLVQ